MSTVERTHTLRIAVETEDPRVAAGLRQLLSAEPDLTLSGESTADVVVVELPPAAGPVAGLRICELARHTPVVVLGFDARVQGAVAGLPAVTFVDKAAALEELVATLRATGTSRPARARTAGSWPRIAVVAAAVFAGPWAFWFSAIAQAHHLIGWRLPQGLALWSIAPLLLIAVGATSGRAGLRELCGRILRVRIPVRTYAVALGLPFTIAALSAGLVTAAGGSVPYGELLSLKAALVYLAYGTGLFLLTEEAAWRGALLPRVQQHLGPGRASIVIGLLWACWHLPLLSTPGEADQGLPRLPFLLLIVATSVLMTALVNSARGSVVVAGAFHASFDACYSWFGVVGDQHAMLWAATALTTAVAAGLLATTRGHLLTAAPTVPAVARP